MKALFIGRFQPFHQGHLYALNEVIKKHGAENVIVGIGSSQFSRTKDNPFTAKERTEMIRRCVKCKIIEVPNTKKDEDWSAQVEKHCGKVLVYSGNEYALKLLKEYGFNVQKLNLKKGYSATEVREKMINNEDWKKLVPIKVAEYLEKINGVKIVRSTS